MSNKKRRPIAKIAKSLVLSEHNIFSQVLYQAELSRQSVAVVCDWGDYTTRRADPSNIIPRSPLYMALPPVLIGGFAVYPERKSHVSMTGLVANFTRRDARLQSVDAITMAQVMDAKAGDAGPVTPCMQGLVNAAAGYRARPGCQQGRRPAPVTAGMQHDQPAGEYSSRLFSQEYFTLLFPLAQHNDTAALAVYVAHPQVGRFGGAQATGIDYPEHGMIPGGQPVAGSGAGVYRLEEPAKRVFWNGAGRRIGRGRGRQVVKRASVELAPTHRPIEESVKGAVITVNRGIAQFLMPERQEKRLNFVSPGRPGTEGQKSRQGIAIEFAGCRTSPGGLATDDKIIKRHGGGGGKGHKITSLYHKTAAVKFAVVLQNNSF